jgi:hypothetical protein
MQDLVNQMPGTVNQMQDMMQTLLPDEAGHLQAAPARCKSRSRVRRVEALENRMKGKKK